MLTPALEIACGDNRHISIERAGVLEDAQFMPVVGRKKLIELTDEFFRQTTTAVECSHVGEHATASHEEEIIYRLRVVGYKPLYEFLVCHYITIL
jgi:hypothetical protein